MADIWYVNEVEGITPVANMILQNQAYVRGEMTDNTEELFKIAGSRKKIRDIISGSIECKNDNKDLQSQRKSISGCKMKIEKQFSSIYYCGNNVKIFPSTEDDDIRKYKTLSQLLMNLIIRNILEKKKYKVKLKSYVISQIPIQGKLVTI